MNTTLKDIKMYSRYVTEKIMGLFINRGKFFTNKDLKEYKKELQEVVYKLLLEKL